jgi:predicted  nucleic acid-binding Zn-ribbon protein
MTSQPRDQYLAVCAELQRVVAERDRISELHAESQAQIDRLRDDLAAARNAYEMQRQDCINLTEKVIPNIREDLAAARALLRDIQRELVGYRSTTSLLLRHSIDAALAGKDEP